MKNLKAHEIQIIIDLAYDATERSKVGKLQLYDPEGRPLVDVKGFPIMSNLAVATFLNVLNALLPKNITGEMEIDDNNLQK